MESVPCGWTRAASLVMAGAAVIAASRSWGWWVCDLDCAGTAAYARLWSLDVHWLAAGYLIVNGLALACMKNPWWGVVLAGGAAGGSLFYLGLSVVLRVWCDHCLATHALVLIAAGLALWPCSWALLRQAGYLGLVVMLVFAGHAATITPYDPTVSPAKIDNSIDTKIDTVSEEMARGRIWGAGLPQVDIVLDPRCSHCRDLAQELPRLSGQITLRFVPHDPDSAKIGAIIIAAGADGPQRQRVVMAVLMGRGSNLTWDDLRPQLAELCDPIPLETRAASAAQIIAHDSAQVLALVGPRGTRSGSLPMAIIHDPAGGPPRIFPKVTWDFLLTSIGSATATASSIATENSLHR